MVLVETVVDEKFIEEMNKFRAIVKDKSLLENCSSSPVVFAERMLGVKLYAWQVYFLQQVLNEINNPQKMREFLALTSRQIGKSTAIAIFCLWACVFNKVPGTIHNNTIVGIVSASEVQSKKLLYEMKKFLRSGDLFMARTYVDSEGKPIFGDKFFTLLLDEGEPNNMTTLTFKVHKKGTHNPLLLQGSMSGSVIKSYPPTSAVLGETFTVVIEDEAGMTDKITDQFHYDYISPTGNSTNAIRMYTSTPWMPNGFFYRLADPFDEFGNNPANRCLFTIEAIKLENPEYYANVMKTINQMNSDGKQAEVQRAYYCRFVKGEKSYFDPDKVLDSFNKELRMQESCQLECDMGVDFGGQTTSKTVITISRLSDNGEVVRLYHKVYGVGEDDNLIDDMKELLSRFNVQRVIPDDCPQGDYMIRKMIELGWDVQPMNFRSDKVKKYGAFRSYLNKGRISSYPDEDLKTEMFALEFAEGSRQSLIMHAPGYTDDLIDSFVMSAYFFLEEESGFDFVRWNDDDDDTKKTFKGSL